MNDGIPVRLKPDTTVVKRTDVDRREVAAIGRRARLDLVFAYRRGRTVLTEAYAEPPFRIGKSLAIGPYAYVILACTGPGVFPGDALRTRVRVERGARVLLVSQAALQVHPAAVVRLKPNGPPEGGHDRGYEEGRTSENADRAVLESRYDVEEDGELDCQWDPVIPFAGARLTQRIDVRITGESRLFWSDALMSGRIGRGEAWRFDELDHELRLIVDGSLTYLERYRLTPPSRLVERPWIAGPAHYVGTTLVHHVDANADRAEHLQQQLDGNNEVRAGVECLGPHLLVGRLLATRGPQFSKARAAFRQMFARPMMRRG